jgi:hypothetical protein
MDRLSIIKRREIRVTSESRKAAAEKRKLTAQDNTAKAKQWMKEVERVSGRKK